MKCYICQIPIVFENSKAIVHDVTVDEYDNVGRLCPECTRQIVGKVALVIEEHGIRTGESIFLTRRVLNSISHVYSEDYTIFLVTREGIKTLIKRLLKR